jgi:hypothetical protein
MLQHNTTKQNNTGSANASMVEGCTEKHWVDAEWYMMEERWKDGKLERCCIKQEMLHEIN